jgi:hypothetical protein
MAKWGIGAALAAVAVFCLQNAVRADQLPVQNPIFSSPLVTYGQTAMAVAAGVTGWSAEGAPDPVYHINTSVIIWQNHTVNDPSADLRASRVDNLITDPTVTEAVATAYSNLTANWWFATDPSQGYQACASIGSGDNALVQTMSSLFQANKGYSLTVAVGHNHGSSAQPPDPQTKFALTLFYSDAEGDHVVVERDLYNDTTTNLLSNHLQDFPTGTVFIAPNDPAVNRPIGIRLVTTTPSGVTASGYFNVTNVRVSEVVPEPATIGVLLAGAMLLVRRRRA